MRSAASTTFCDQLVGAFVADLAVRLLDASAAPVLLDVVGQSACGWGGDNSLDERRRLRALDRGRHALTSPVAGT